MKPIYFRADADKEIGYGHFVRSLALADMLKDKFNCVFFTQSPSEFQRNQLNNICKYVELPNDNSKFDVFLEYLKGDEIVVLDNYFYTTEYQAKIKAKGSTLICIDDIHSIHFLADAVINHSLGIKEDDYSKEPYTELFLGLNYALLRKPFLNAINTSVSKPINNKDLHVLVTFGGADKYQIAKTIANNLSQLDKVKSISVLSLDQNLNKNSDKIKCMANLSAEEMVRLFEAVDLAIIPASSIMKEALACKANVIGGYFVDNQINSYTQFLKEKSIVGFGDLSRQENIDRLIAFINSENLSNILLNKNIYSSDIAKNYIDLFSKYA